MTNGKKRMMRDLIDNTYNHLNKDQAKNNDGRAFESMHSLHLTAPRIDDRFKRITQSVHKIKTQIKTTEQQGMRINSVNQRANLGNFYRTYNCSLEGHQASAKAEFNHCFYESIKANTNPLVKSQNVVPGHKFFLLRRSLINCSLTPLKKMPDGHKQKIHQIYKNLASEVKLQNIR